jgi:transposase InsO family protein
MPWQERSIMSERQEFIMLAGQEDANIAGLCRQFGISRKTAYKWLERAKQGDTALLDRSRRPQTSPQRTSAELEARIVDLRQRHPAWGGRKLHHRLQAMGEPAPPPSTITSILRRHGLLSATPPRRDFVRFAREQVNDLWQMDFMGHRALTTGRVHPLTVVDDHSRFALLLNACANQQQTTVKAQLTALFRHCGLPQIILCDNGAPWATAGMGGLTSLEAWLLQLGVEPWHGRPHHPQTQGKVERFHGTIAAEVFTSHPAPFPDLPTVQAAFDAFRARYNHERPHEALAHAVPASRYQPSPRPFPEVLPAPAYGPDDVVRIVTVHGSISWQGHRAFVSRGLIGQPVAIRPTDQDGVWDIVFCQRPVARIDRHHPDKV